ncbi:glycosyl hydrolase [Bacillus sp. SD088]|uniref:glycosyl hydrolase n=1 Tax=Bacillus sp. SD088 TaxID=2782012 RepID=UPI001A96A970|nr:glycosyl hydrolase [Bacillus sp. SD088]MBO0992220.1 beta-mannosidase [Bacillus sp. SD088]
MRTEQKDEVTVVVTDGNLNENEWVEISFTLSKTGYYKLVIKQKAMQGYSRNNLFINGDSYGEIESRLSPGQIGDMDIMTLKLGKGIHSIQFGKDWGGIDIQSITLIPSEAPAKLKPSFTLTNPSASKECKALMNYFKKIYGKKIITGQHTAYARGPELDYIEKITGKLPALRGFDLLSYSLHTETENPTEDKIVEINENKGSIEEAIEWGAKHRGLVTFCWHWYAPLGGKDKAFYTEHTDFDLEQALISGTKEYEALLADMDEIAEQLKRLQAKNIPVLWRPLHEADGKWFWWGAKGPEVYKKLYVWMYDHFTNDHHLNNLIWVWNAPDAEWYPGDEYVDIASVDIYVPDGNYGPLKLAFEQAVNLVQYKKPVTLSENGPIPDPDKLIESETSWLWYMPWYGDFVTGGKSTTDKQLKKIYSHSYCVTLDALSNIEKED